MNQETRPGADWRATFGPFTLFPAARLLERDGVPVRLGGRALDLLVVLVEFAGQIVSKKDLMTHVWPDVVVEEGSLRFHMVAVRKALGDGEGGGRYIVNTASKGYTFVAPVHRSLADAPPVGIVSGRHTAKPLPGLATPLVGRAQEVQVLVASVLQRRLLCIVGAGGIGKTTVAMATAQAAAGHFNGDVHFVDLSAISQAALACSSVASAVGLQNRLDDLAALTTHLAERKALIVLDCCEHVVAGAAEVAEALMRQCPHVHVLATSREPLQADGEFVHRLAPLAFPCDGEGGSVDEALTFPAVKLFVDRAAASGAGFVLEESQAPLVSQLCRELQGIALAIELAAGRVEALGLQAIVSHFDAHAKLMWHGRRTAIPRHQTLAATLDWSFNLLSADEKGFLARLSAFAGTFSLEAAIDVCAFDVDKPLAIELIASLVSKSLVTVDAGGMTLRYAMLDTTRSYCSQKLEESGEEPMVSQRFASHFGVWAQRQTGPAQDNGAGDVVGQELANLRAALEWHFREGRQGPDAVRLAASLCALLLRLSKVAECARWARAALSRMPPSFVGSHFEMRLQGALGQSLMFSQGGSGGEAAIAFRRAIEVAEQLRDFRSNLHLLNGYAVLLHRAGQYAQALAVARKAQALLSELDDAESRAIVDSLMGVALELVGQVGEAQEHWERCFSHGAGASTVTTAGLGFDFHIRAMCGLARNLWLTGHYARAVAVADETIEKARRSGHAVTHCIALIWAGSVYFWARSAERMEAIADALERVARQHSLIPYLSVAGITRGQLLIAAGHSAEGVERVRSSLEVLRDFRYEMVTSVSLTVMARGLSDMSLHAAALAMCDEVEGLIRSCGDLLRLPELLATRGHCLAAAGRREESHGSYLAAIELARSQGVTSGQVQAALALAQLWIEVGRIEDAHRLLAPYVADAGHESSPDLNRARSLLERELRRTTNGDTT